MLSVFDRLATGKRSGERKTRIESGFVAENFFRILFIDSENRLWRTVILYFNHHHLTVPWYFNLDIFNGVSSNYI